MTCVVTSYSLNLNSSDNRQLTAMEHDSGKPLSSHARDGEHPYTILNGCVWHINGTRVCSYGGYYTSTCPEACDIATVSIV